MKKIFKFLSDLLGILGLLILILFGSAFLLAFPVKWLWNWVIVDIFNIKSITYWQAFGLFLITSILFKIKGSTNFKSKDD
jgi:hypothetical protein